MKSNTVDELFFPVRIVAKEGISNNEEGLLVKKTLQIGLSEPVLSRFKGKGYIILDFGKELCGTARLLTYRAGNNEAKVRLRFGESVAETCAEDGYKGACNDHSNRDIVTTLRNWSDMRFCQTGFRFLRIDFLQNRTYIFKSIVAEGEVFSAPFVYDYNGPDKRTKEIFDTAVRTISLCASSGMIWDGIKRDRLVWIGDMYPEAMAMMTCFGRQKIIETSLDYVRDSTPLPAWMNGFPMYSMWWIIIVSDYYFGTGAGDYVKKQLDYMKKLLKCINKCVAEDGTMNYPLYFVDWPTHGQVDEMTGVRAINVIAAKRAIKLLNEFGEDATDAEQILEKLMRGDFSVPGGAKQVIALKHFAIGNLSKAEADRLIEGGAEGLSTFMSYFILTAIRDYHGAEKAIEIMKEYYGAMLDRGATTFFEDFNMKWLEGSGRIDEMPKEGEKDLHGDYGAFCYVGYRHSFCHGWSAGVIMFIKENC